MKIENYNNTKTVLMNLSNLMRKEDWDSIAIIEESGEFTKAIDESVSIISNVMSLFPSFVICITVGLASSYPVVIFSKFNDLPLLNVVTKVKLCVLLIVSFFSFNSFVDENALKEKNIVSKHVKNVTSIIVNKTIYL